MHTIGQPLISALIPVLAHEIDRAALEGQGLSKLLSVPLGFSPSSWESWSCCQGQQNVVEPQSSLEQLVLVDPEQWPGDLQ